MAKKRSVTSKNLLPRLKLVYRRLSVEASPKVFGDSRGVALKLPVKYRPRLSVA
jgi:hypothetical protein